MTDESSSQHNGTDGEEREESEFYTHAAEYWDSVPANLESMLGGYGHISSTDVGGSFKFLRSFIIVRTFC